MNIYILNGSIIHIIFTNLKLISNAVTKQNSNHQREFKLDILNLEHEITISENVKPGKLRYICKTKNQACHIDIHIYVTIPLVHKDKFMY